MKHIKSGKNLKKTSGNFSFIEIDPEKISFGGLGAGMYVLSLNKKALDYLY